MNVYKVIILVLASVVLAILDEIIRHNKTPFHNVYHGFKNGVLLMIILNYVL
jgi:hypothetical protein